MVAEPGLELGLLTPHRPEFFLLHFGTNIDNHALSNVGLWITQLLSPAFIHAPGGSEHPRIPWESPRHGTSTGHTAQGLEVGPEWT